MTEKVRIDIAIVYFTSICQSIIDFSDEFQLFQHPIFRQKTKQSLKRMIEDMETQVNAFVKPNSVFFDIKKRLLDGQSMEDINFGTKEVCQLTDYSETILDHYKEMMRLSILAEKDVNKANEFVSEYMQLLKKYELA